MKKSIFYRSLVALIVMSLSFIVVPAYADSVQSSPLYVTVNGIEYKYFSQINTVSGYNMQISTGTSTAKTITVPIGYMGVLARAYTEDGSFVKQSRWTYNATSSISCGVHLEFKGSEYADKYYYSKGQVKFYNGDGYSKVYTCNATPNMKMKSASGNDMIPTEIQKNESGEIYGSEIFLNLIGIQPDLILAVGTNGETGYVKASDLDMDEATTPEEAIEQMNNYVSYIIPLYESDGTTVIGGFLVG